MRKKPSKKPSSRVDPVTLEVIRNALPAISNEMSYDLQRTSYNMMIYEVRDYSCTLLDHTGLLLSQNIGGVSHFISDIAARGQFLTLHLSRSLCSIAGGFDHSIARWIFEIRDGETLHRAATSGNGRFTARRNKYAQA